MKKLVLVLMIALFLLGSAAMAEDVVSSASVSVPSRSSPSPATT